MGVLDPCPAIEPVGAAMPPVIEGVVGLEVVAGNSGLALPVTSWSCCDWVVAPPHAAVKATAQAIKEAFRFEKGRLVAMGSPIGEEL
jgi:hypothetical protein